MIRSYEVSLFVLLYPLFDCRGFVDVLCEGGCVV